jgi:hypothetical protein
MTHDPEFVGCPGCGAPAEIIDRFVLDSTDGPLEHLKLWCVTGRWFTVLTENLPASPSVGGREVERWRAS